MSDPVFLQPQNPPIIATEPRFCLPYEISLHLREKFFSFSGDDFSIKDASNTVEYFKCSGRTFSLREKKVLLDNTGAPVLNIRDQFFALVPNYKIYQGSDRNKLLFEIRAKFTLFKPKFTLHFTNLADGNPITLELKGDWLARRTVIRAINHLGVTTTIARVHSPIGTGRNLFLNKQDYYVTIAPGVDIAMIVAICICLDENAKDD
ncbi:hypothetical protein K493DRAFT_229289 [Basidiobolus meristosporus CBS 931.73]|uniref:DUF567-domain-containing protein n=1 Tax=Basidiobolus meristosporus CBS 931.73 TaxID=1314790 RepID=A0A1Y1XYY8_9FUNG|nr:hypothetical protein K493DRAFT_229289 [Basidiobolus meristosporus CBS 931.73]|eukprot:ORX90942.1 hypothetical protein K493DRAFT_229289 [Basidiobolus meristosporus CBS 931.73]